MTLAVGLTGGVASGKSLVGDLFRQQGVTVIDADQVAREVVAPGTPGLARLVERFGPEILASDGTLDRRRMRERVFTDDEARRALELLLHPLIHVELAHRRDALTADYGILMIPLLARTGMRELVGRILVVDAPEELQIQRLMQRDGIGREFAKRMLAAQESRQQRLETADDVLLNADGPERLRTPVAELHAFYLALAHGTANPEKRLYLPATPV